jgi:hypothetical protein
MTSVRRETAVLALLCVGLGVAVCGARAEPATATGAPPAAAAADGRCPVTAPVSKDPGVLAAVAELSQWATDPVRNQIYLGQFPCHATKTVIVYRLPGHRDLDNDARAVVAAHHVRAVLADSKYAYGPLRAAADHIRADEASLAADGIQIAWTLIERGDAGCVQVGVQGDLARARTELAKYGSFVQVTAA